MDRCTRNRFWFDKTKRMRKINVLKIWNIWIINDECTRLPFKITFRGRWKLYPLLHVMDFRFGRSTPIISNPFIHTSHFQGTWWTAFVSIESIPAKFNRLQRRKIYSRHFTPIDIYFRWLLIRNHKTLVHLMWWFLDLEDLVFQQSSKNIHTSYYKRTSIEIVWLSSNCTNFDRL